MGVDIGVCKYNEEREKKIQRLLILEKLPDVEGKVSHEEYLKISRECNDECSAIEKIIPEGINFIGRRMHSLYCQLRTELVLTEQFSFTHEYENERVYPETLKALLRDFKILVPAIDKDELQHHISIIDFFGYLIDNNLMIYPC